MRKELCKFIGQKIRRLRAKRGLTLEELAFKSEIHPNYLGDLERGLRNPTIVNVEKISEGLSVPLLEIFNDRPVLHAHKVLRSGLPLKDKNLSAYMLKISKRHDKSEIKFIIKLVKDLSGYLKSR